MKSRIAVIVLLGLTLIVGSALAQSPGSQGPSGPFDPSRIFQVPDIIPPDAADLTRIQLPLSKPVVTGYVVLKESATGGTGQTNWSDIVIFTSLGNVAPDSTVGPANNAVIVTYISDSPSGPGYITPADLARAGMSGLTITAIQSSSNTVYVNEYSPAHTQYNAGLNIYYFVSSDHDVPGIGTSGLIVLSALLALTGLVFVVRRRAGAERIA